MEPKKAGFWEREKKSRKKALEKRGALSLEDEPLEAYEEEEDPPRISLPKPLFKVLLILLVCGLAVFLWINRGNLAPDRVGDWIQDSLLGMGVGPGFPTPITGSDIAKENLLLMDQDAAMVSDTSFVVLNKTAKELSNRQHSFSNPILRVAGSRALIYNLGGNTFQIESRSKTILKKDELTNNILAGDISQSGNFVIATESKGYFSKLTVYGKNSQATDQDDYLYRYYFSDYYITDVTINQEGNSVAAVGVTAFEGALRAALYVFDDYKSPDAKESPDYIFEDNLILAVRYLDNGNIAVVGDRESYVVNPATKETLSYPYQQRSLANFEITSDTLLLALSKSNDGRACDIALLDHNGTVSGEFSTSHKATSMSYRGGTVALLDSGVIYTYSSSGEETGDYDAGSDARKILMYTSNSAYVLGISEIRQVSLRG